ncbi:MAG: hypothetical protein QQN63_01455 [Nitrosopumilus sp.]
MIDLKNEGWLKQASIITDLEMEVIALKKWQKEALPYLKRLDAEVALSGLEYDFDSIKGLESLIQSGEKV